MRRLALLLVFLLLSSCGGRSTRDLDTRCPDVGCACLESAECPRSLECIDGKCQAPAVVAGLGGFGVLCERNEDCDSGLCLAAGDGSYRRCSQACPPACPDGWRCSAAGQCIEDSFRLCLPCQEDVDCHPSGADFCARPAGASEGVCQRDCAGEGTCEAGYSCRQVESAGRMRDQCVSDEACGCGRPGVRRACTNTNNFGTCFGAEVCDGAGFAGCTAPAASAELCNGRDDNCDGRVDVEDPSLRPPPGVVDFPRCQLGDAPNCAGTWTCTVAVGLAPDWACLPAAPLVETCNALDDDCDGEVDEDFLTGGVLLDVNHCGACNRSCTDLVPGLAVDAEGRVRDGAVSCELVDGAPTCVPRQCEPGRAPGPEAQPTQCETLVGLQCASCDRDADCVWSANRCVMPPQDEVGACAQGCGTDAPYPGCTGVAGEQGCCPEGSLCQNDGGVLLCAPVSGSCGCRPGREGTRRSCFRTGPQGNQCSGLETCERIGSDQWRWSSCEADEVSRELCNGMDDDCDGEVDETFLDTQGTGTYDTDEHCGRCFESCLVLPNAEGRCGSAGPACVIDRCLNGQVTGDAWCNVDADCRAGFACAPGLFQCVRSCRSDMDCGAGDRCVDNRCGRACGTDADCRTLGEEVACLAGACGVRYRYVDLDTEVANGCECPAAAGTMDDEPDTFESFPEAGLPYVDRNCDGLDGNAARALFVRPGVSGGTGTRAQPFGSLARAQQAFAPARHDYILVAGGVYDEVLTLRAGVRWYGGYSNDFATRDIAAMPSRIAPTPSSEPAAVIARNLSARTVLSGFVVEGWDVVSRAGPGTDGDSSVAVLVAASPGLELVDVLIRAGRAGDGGEGVDGPPGRDGDDGGRGRDAAECRTTSCRGESQAGGAGGANPACAAPGTRGGNASGDRNTQEYTPPLGRNGRGGSNATYTNAGDPSFASLCKYDCQVPNDLEGDDASPGNSGTSGGGGSGCFQARGRITPNGWTSGDRAANGTAGTLGEGGGGGGAGGGVRNSNGPGCTVGNRVGDLGATGGGGGAGGCGGQQGQRGGNGGASVGLLIVDTAAPAVLQGVVIEMADGGAGGRGGDGGRGGLGGQGGLGGISSPPAWCGGTAGRGGRGGNGGDGGGGGGGCGGPSYGLLRPSGVRPSGVDIRSLGRGGGGGDGGRSPFGPSAVGQPGVAGPTAEVQSL